MKTKKEVKKKKYAHIFTFSEGNIQFQTVWRNNSQMITYKEWSKIAPSGRSWVLINSLTIKI